MGKKKTTEETHEEKKPPSYAVIEFAGEKVQVTTETARTLQKILLLIPHKVLGSVETLDE